MHTIKSFFPVSIPDFLYADEAMLVTSDNDPYMTSLEADALHEELDIHRLVLENAGHINADSGFGEWPWVKEWVKG